MARIKKYTLIYGAPAEDFYGEIKNEDVLVCEMRPYLFGVKVLLRSLKKAKIKSTLICDSALGHLFFLKRIKKVYLFGLEDNVFPPGALSVKILAAWHGIPVEILKGGEIKTADFADKDAGTFLGRRIAPGKVKAISPQNEVLK